MQIENNQLAEEHVQNIGEPTF